MLDLKNVTHEDFNRCLNQPFVIDVDTSAPFEVELVTVETRGSFDPSSGRRQAFCAIFRGPLMPTLDQSIRALTNDTLGKMELFLVPVGPDDVGMLYEAVFT